MRLSFLLIFVLVLLGCAGAAEDSSSSSGAGGGDADASGSELRIETSPYMLMQGEENRYFCFTARVPDPAPVVTKITPIYGQAVHHLVIWTPLLDEPEGAFHCPELVKTTWIPLFTGGIQTSPLEMPKGVGAHLVAGQQILIQAHLLNASSGPVSDVAGVVFSTSEDPSLIPAGFWGANNTQFSIPPLASGYAVTQTCAAPHDMNVFAAFGHMHMHGRTLDVSRGPVAGQDVVFSENWKFDDQPTVPASIHFAQGDPITIRCTYDNNSMNPVPYGESSYSEMCAFAAYYYPWPGFSGCTQ